MTDKIKHIVMIVLMGGIMFALALFAWFKPADAFSDVERRPLKQFPDLSVKTLWSGGFMSNFEGYATDQFPMRETFRTIKAASRLYMFNQSDNNDIYENGGFISEMNYPLNPNNIAYAAKKFETVYNTYFKDNGGKAYVTIVPDKNEFLAEGAGAPHFDYKDFAAVMQDKTKNFAHYIDIKSFLELDDYYKTDTHWRQEKIFDVAQTIAGEMGVQLKGEYTQTKVDKPFKGVYYGQYALPIEADELYYMDSDIFKNTSAAYFDSNGQRVDIPVYDMNLAVGRDPYEMFLSGSQSLITIENPNATSDRQLIIFRDSFGSAISPYFVEGYSRVTLVDIRYLSTASLGMFFPQYGLNFENADVLFLYSTLVVNQSATLLK